MDFFFLSRSNFLSFAEMPQQEFWVTPQYLYFDLNQCTASKMKSSPDSSGNFNINIPLSIKRGLLRIRACYYTFCKH